MTTPTAPDNLELSPAEMRRLGYQAIDEIVAHFAYAVADLKHRKALG